ncbi:hypothetical protein E4U42_006301 [Claviceps africana]|uniref:Uncharacterized protein n=1 Tax=Claviceps africana TaxID=83212 RepID=A0A8K0NLB1_9HYPO|nr:hypothetical protein E4U42_006301 [Claviceps africana]
MNQFSHLEDFEFNGSGEEPGCSDLCSRFLGKDRRVPPIRGIVKEFGQSDEELGTLRTGDTL